MKISLSPNENRLIACVYIALFLIVASSALKGKLSIEDPFHYGEYFASSFGNVAYPENSPPLTIHGALDYLPSSLVIKFWDEGNFFLPTIAFYKLLDFLSSFIFVCIASLFVKNQERRIVTIFFIGLVSIQLVGYRDIFLLLSLFITLLVSKSPKLLFNFSGFSLLALLGVVGSFGVFWSYDRGIAGAVSIGIFLLINAVKSRKYLIAIAVFFVNLFFLSVIFDYFSISNYLDNLIVLLSTSSQWRYPWSGETVSLVVAAILFNLVAFLFLFRAIKYLGCKKYWSFYVAAFVLAVLMLKIGSNRADLQHVYYSFWLPLLVVVFLLNKKNNLNLFDKIVGCGVVILLIYLAYQHKSFVFLVSCGFLLVLIWNPYLSVKVKKPSFFYVAAFFVILGSFVHIGSGVYKGKYNWLEYIANPPDNKSMATQGVAWAAESLKRNNVTCIFDLSNNGVINGLLEKPSCSRFSYPVYANKGYESELISSLKYAEPKALVYSSDFWSYRIDNKDMVSRFPLLDKFIVERYPFQDCAYGYCIRLQENYIE